MPKIKNSRNGKFVEVKNGEGIREACKSLGVQFNCEEGYCGTCLMQVLEGKENLSELTDNEKEMFLDDEMRLACQCKIKDGDVTIEY